MVGMYVRYLCYPFDQHLSPPIILFDHLFNSLLASLAVQCLYCSHLRRYWSAYCGADLHLLYVVYQFLLSHSITYPETAHSIGFGKCMQSYHIILHSIEASNAYMLLIVIDYFLIGFIGKYKYIFLYSYVCYLFQSSLSQYYTYSFSDKEVDYWQVAEIAWIRDYALVAMVQDCCYG